MLNTVCLPCVFMHNIAKYSLVLGTLHDSSSSENRETINGRVCDYILCLLYTSLVQNSYLGYIKKRNGSYYIEV